ncbi:hypothetical protein FDA94_29785 [Herbidospora galbida]|uniref:Uncharacterized protein n=1 Tax=Herbidospora galbida TaxID=2575442 RepID=A0A4U3M618_9ACTN|nr:hypothetical protein FDA94_29785 [Herbidospora galbida]
MPGRHPVTSLKALDAATHGPHVSPPHPESGRVRWLSPTSRAVRVRVRRHTCECQPTLYELCQSGGLMFIRRTRRVNHPSTMETDWLPTRDAEQLWTRILTGEVR